MGKVKKVNPRRRPVSQADIDKAKSEAVHLAMAIFLTVMKDDFDFDQDQIKHAWDRIDKLSQEVAEHRVSVKDLLTVLDEEYDILLL